MTCNPDFDRHFEKRELIFLYFIIVVRNSWLTSFSFDRTVLLISCTQISTLLYSLTLLEWKEYFQKTGKNVISALGVAFAIYSVNSLSIF